MMWSAPSGVAQEARDRVGVAHEISLGASAERTPTTGSAVSSTADQECDSTWDGAAFGVLPGMGAGFLINLFVNQGDDLHRHELQIVGVTAAVGAALGYWLDGVQCHEP